MDEPPEPPKLPEDHLPAAFAVMVPVGAVLFVPLALLISWSEGSLHAHLWLVPLGLALAVVGAGAGWAVGHAMRWYVKLVRQQRRARAAAVRVGHGDRCPFCHDAVEPTSSVACTGCLARHHAGCWDDHRACAACGGTTRYAGVEETEGRTPRSPERQKDAP